MPLMALAATTIDLTVRDMGSVVDRNLHYLDTDLTCYGEYPEWVDYRSFVSKKFGCVIGSCKGISLPKHSEGADAALRAYLSTFTPWELTAFDEMTRSAKSVIVALNYYLGNAPLQEACRASVLEELENRGKWGTVEGDHDVSDRTLKMAMASSKFFA
ncbi:ATP synthase mitochondrial F1 complex assembly factor 2, partial [Perkinsus olseni]